MSSVVSKSVETGLVLLRQRKLEETIKLTIDLEQVQIRDRLLAKGGNYLCLKCNTVYKHKPQSEVDDGFETIDECPKCKCDLFLHLSEIDFLNGEVEPVDGVIILKQHNFKYCKCRAGEFHTSDATTECGVYFKIDERDLVVFDGGVACVCPVSGLVLIQLNSTKEEMTEARYVKYPLCP